MQVPSPETPKKRQRRKDARPAEIIAAAMDLWRDRGFAATRLEDVAAGAGIAKGTIYRYFSSKEGLFEAALQHRLVATMDQAKGQAQAFDGPIEPLLMRFFETISAELVEGGSAILLRILLSEGHRFPDLVATYEKAALTRGLGTIRHILNKGVTRGELRPEAADLDPRLVIAPVIMIVMSSTVFRFDGFPTLRQSLEQHIQILLRGLRPDPSTSV